MAKTTLKTQEFSPVEGAKTPAATTLTEIKETEKELITPYSIHVPTFLSNPVITSSIVAPSVIVKSDIESAEEKPADEKKETLPILSDSALFRSPLISSGILSHSPLISPRLILGKTTVKTSELKPVDDAKTPAATKLAEVKETEKEIATPIVSHITYHAPTLLTSPFIGSGLVSLF